MKKITIAIDGPAGAGKSTIAKLVAEKLGYIYIDTGAMYRAVTLKFLEGGKEFSSALVTDIANHISLSFQPEPGCNHVYMDGSEVTDAIRSNKVTKEVSEVSSEPGVRTAMVDLQRKIGAGGGAVLDGRDIGTVVFPQAEIKVFLTASVEERAKRRFLELKGKGKDVSLATIIQDIAARDKYDSERAVAPLRCASDAHYLDTSHMSISQVVTAILNLCKE